MQISAPIKLEFSDEEMKLVEEMGERISILESLAEKNNEEKLLLLLMQEIKKKYNKENSPEIIIYLKNTIGQCAEDIKKIDWGQYENTVESTSNTKKSTVVEPRKIRVAGSFSQGIQDVKLKPVKKNEQTTHALVTKGKNALSGLVPNEKELSRERLKKPKDRKNSVTPHDEEQSSELAKKLIKKREWELEDKNSIGKQINVSEEASLALITPSSSVDRNLSSDVSTMNSEVVNTSSLIDEVYSNKAKQLLEKLRLSLKADIFQNLEFELQEKICNENKYTEEDFNEFTERVQTMIEESTTHTEYRPLSTILEVSESNTSSMIVTGEKQMTEQMTEQLVELDELLKGIDAFIDEQENKKPRPINIENLASNPECEATTESSSKLEQGINDFFKKQQNNKNAPKNAPVILDVIPKKSLI